MIPGLNSDQEKIRVSLKYQVLCGLTAMVGTVKNLNKSTEELVQIQETFV
jgi:hypothetical protein